MSDILRLPVATAPRRLRSPEAVLDPTTAAVVDQAVAVARDDAYVRGCADGRATAQAELDQLRSSIEVAAAALREELDAQREEAVVASVELARTLANMVLERTPPDDASHVLSRVQTALALLDADEIEVALHPQDHAVLADEAAPPGVRWVADASLAPGDARMRTPFGGAELTRAALLDAAVAVLAGDRR